MPIFGKIPYNDRPLFSRDHHEQTKPAITLCVLLLKPNFDNIGEVMFSGAFIFVALGILLPSAFVIIAKAVALVGIAKSDVAQRLALFLPILTSFTIFGESLTLAKGVGIVLVLINGMGIILRFVRCGVCFI